MDTRLHEYFQKFLETSADPEDRTECALRHAKTLIKFQELEEEGLVRLFQREEEESYFDVWGEPETEEEREEIETTLDLYGCWIVGGEYYDPTMRKWEWADSVGMCTGYKNPTDPFQNEYISAIMASTIEEAEQAQLRAGLITG